MVGILIFSTGGALLAGQGLDTAVHTGFSLAQLGEFAFIIASLGCSLGVVRDFIYPVIISVSVITTFTTPYMIKAGDPVSRWLEAKLPPKLLAKINPNPEDLASKSKAETNEWSGLMKSYILRIVLYSVMLIAVMMVLPGLLDKLTLKLLPGATETLRDVIALVVILIIMTPFLYGLAVVNGGISDHASKLLDERESNKWPILSLIVLRFLIASAFIIAAITHYFSLEGWALLAVVGSVMLVFFVAKFQVKHLSGLEKRFLANLNAREELERQKAPVTSSLRDKMEKYDVHTEVVTISPDFTYIGKTLREMPFRKGSGVNVVKILRGNTSIIIPTGDERIYPGDKLLAVGTSEQIAEFCHDIEMNTTVTEEEPQTDFAVLSAELTPESYLSGKSLRESSMRAGGCMIISVLHGEKLITNPGADFRFSVGDTVWIAGEKDSCEWFLR